MDRGTKSVQFPAAGFVQSETGAQFTSQGVLKFPLKEKQPEVILERLMGLLESLAAGSQLA